MGTARLSTVRDTMITLLLPILILGMTSARAEEGACSEHIKEKCEDTFLRLTPASCNSKFGGFEGNAHNLHRVILDDFTDSMTYLLMSSSFSTDVKNRMGFSKFFMGHSDKMWARGKDMMKYVLKRGGRMGTGFQIPPNGANSQSLTELQGLGLTLDLLKARASDLYVAYKHSLASNNSMSFDPATAHMLEEVVEDYTGDINDAARKLNTLSKMMRQDRGMGLNMFDRTLM